MPFAVRACRGPGPSTYADLQSRHSPRLATRAEVAQYCGLSDRTVGDWVAKSLLPPPLPGTSRWDLKAVDQHLDRLSGLTTPDREVGRLSGFAKRTVGSASVCWERRS